MHILFDMNLKRPGCAILQALAGCDHVRISQLFPAETWLVNPTPAMRVWDLPEDRINEVVQVSINAVRKNKDV